VEELCAGIQVQMILKAVIEFTAGEAAQKIC
jgi:hypothetical protein